MPSLLYLLIFPNTSIYWTALRSQSTSRPFDLRVFISVIRSGSDCTDVCAPLYASNPVIIRFSNGLSTYSHTYIYVYIYSTMMPLAMPVSGARCLFFEQSCICHSCFPWWKSGTGCFAPVCSQSLSPAIICAIIPDCPCCLSPFAPLEEELESYSFSHEKTGRQYQQELSILFWSYIIFLTSKGQNYKMRKCIFIIDSIN